MNTDRRELVGYLKLLLELKRDTRGLFTVTKGGVENSYLFFCVAIDKEDNSPQFLSWKSYHICGVFFL